eukprot:239093-Chlamydomonas_euryale.AAC.1
MRKEREKSDGEGAESGSELNGMEGDGNPGWKEAGCSTCTRVSLRPNRTAPAPAGAASRLLPVLHARTRRAGGVVAAGAEQRLRHVWFFQQPCKDHFPGAAARTNTHLCVVAHVTHHMSHITRHTSHHHVFAPVILLYSCQGVRPACTQPRPHLSP